MSEITDLIADVREQVLYLQELGVESLDVSFSDKALYLKHLAEQQSSLGAEISNLGRERDIANRKPEFSNLNARTDSVIGRIGTPAESRPAGSRLASLPTLASLSKRGESDLLEKTVAENLNVKKTSETLTAITTQILSEPAETLEQIRAEIGPDCSRCKLSTLGRKQVVNSTGNFNADLMFVGEAPGADEDEQGFPFVGRAGKLLTDIMMAIGFSREDVFIGNINRCRPPGNRAPEQDETAACRPFIQREIAVVRPKVIVVLGATAAQNLLETKLPIGKLRGQFHDYFGTKVMPTFHPAYLLRDPNKKREVWEDMKMVRDYLNAA